MDELKKRKQTIYALLLLLAALVAAGLLIYRFLRPGVIPRRIEERVRVRIPEVPVPAPPPEEEPERPPVTPEEEMIRIEAPAILQLTDFAVLSPTLNTQEDRILFYKKEGGNLFSYDFDGNIKEKVSNLTIVGMIEAIWSPKRDRAAVFYLDKENIRGFLQIGAASASILPLNIKNLTWSPDGKRMAYTQITGNNLGIAVADDNAAFAKTVFETQLLDARLQWLSPSFISLTTAPSGAAEGYSWLLDLRNRALERIAGPLFGLETLFAPDGQKVLMSFTNNRGAVPRLEVRGVDGTPLQGIEFSTLVEKCQWAGSEEIFCGVPSLLASENPLPDAYLQGEFTTSDALYRFRPAKGEVTRFEIGGRDISNLLITRDKKIIFFINREDGTLWRVRLP